MPVTDADINAVLNSSGSTQTGVSDADINQMLQLSAQEKEKQEFDQPLTAAAAGAARGISFGLSDVALTKTGLVEPETLSKLKEYNPIASTAGELGGIVAPAFVTGGSNLLLKGAASGVKGVSALGAATEAAVLKGLASEATKTAGRKILEKAAAVGARGAVEGAFYGTGQIVSESALGEKELSAEKVLSQVGLSTLLSGAAGSTLSVVGAGIKAAIQKAAPAIKDLGSFLSGVPRETLETMRRVPDAIDDVAQKAETVEASLNQHAKEVVADYAKLKTDYANDLSQRIDRALTQLNENGSVVKQEFEKSLVDKGVRNWDSIFETHKQRLLRGAKEGFGDVQKIADKMDAIKSEVAQWMRGEAGLAKDAAVEFKDLYLAPRQLNALKTIFQNNSNYRVTGEVSSAINDLYKDLAQNANKVFETAVSPKIKQLNSGFTMLYDAEDALKKFGFKDYAHDPEKFYRLFGTNAQQWDLAKQALEQMDEMLGSNFLDQAKIGRAVKELYGSKGLSKSFTGRSLLIPGLTTLAGAPFGVAPAVLGGLVGALAQSPLASRMIAETSVLAGDAAQPVLDKALKFGLQANQYVPENLAPWLTAHVSALATLDKKQKQYDRAVDGAIKSMTEKGSPSKGMDSIHFMPLQGDEDSLNKSEKMLETYFENAFSPDILQKNIEKNLGEVSLVAPELSKTIASKMALQVQFLAAKAPKNPYPPTSEYYQTWKPSDVDLATFARYAAAVERPMSVIDDLKSNRVSPEGIETLRMMYPKIYEDITKRFMDFVSSSPVKIGYAKRLQLSDIFNIDFEPELKSVQTYQRTFGNQAATPNRTSSKQVKLTPSQPSQAQKIEMR